MKKLLLSFFLIVFVSVSFAQQRSFGQWVGKASGGINITSKGWYGELGVEKVIKNSLSSIQVSFLYYRNTYETKVGSDVNVSNYLGTVFYGYTFETSSPLRICVMGGGFIGAESIPQYATLGVRVDHDSQMIYGPALATQLDYSVSKKVSIYFQPTLLYSPKSTYDEFDFLTGLGLKYYF